MLTYLNDLAIFTLSVLKERDTADEEALDLVRKLAFVSSWIYWRPQSQLDIMIQSLLFRLL